MTEEFSEWYTHTQSDILIPDIRNWFWESKGIWTWNLSAFWAYCTLLFYLYIYIYIYYICALSYVMQLTFCQSHMSMKPLTTSLLCQGFEPVTWIDYLHLYLHYLQFFYLTFKIDLNLNGQIRKYKNIWWQNIYRGSKVTDEKRIENNKDGWLD